MKNLKEQYERYFGKLTERARTSDSDVKTLVRMRELAGSLIHHLHPNK